MSNLTQFNGAFTGYSYDDANRLTGVDNRSSETGSAIATYAYTLDDNGNRTGIEQTVPFGISAIPSSTGYTMNAKANRLLQAGDTAFTYNAEGQLASKTGQQQRDPQVLYLRQRPAFFCKKVRSLGGGTLFIAIFGTLLVCRRHTI